MQHQLIQFQFCEANRKLIHNSTCFFRCRIPATVLLTTLKETQRKNSLFLSLIPITSESPPFQCRFDLWAQSYNCEFAKNFLKWLDAGATLMHWCSCKIFFSFQRLHRGSAAPQEHDLCHQRKVGQDQGIISQLCGSRSAQKYGTLCRQHFRVPGVVGKFFL